MLNSTVRTIRYIQATPCSFSHNHQHTVSDTVSMLYRISAGSVISRGFLQLEINSGKTTGLDSESFKLCHIPTQACVDKLLHIA